MSSSQEDANSASWREEQRSSSQSPPASPNATPPSAQPHKNTTTAAMPRASPCGSDKILETTDEERALASFSFQAPAFLSKKKSNDPISTENTTRPLQKTGSFFRQPLRPLNPGQSSSGTSAAKGGISTAPTAQRGDKSSQETIHATDKTPATPAPSKTAQAAGQKRNADFASLTPFLSRTATSTPALLTKRPRPSSPLIPAHARGNKSVKELLSSRSASMAFRPEGSSAGHGMRKMPAADSPMMQSLLFGMRSSGSVAASQSSSQLTPAVQSNAISSASLGDTQSTQNSELPNSASKVRDTQSSGAFSDQGETSTAPAATFVEHAQPTDADPMDKSRPMHQERSSSPSDASQSPPPPAQPQAVARILPAPVELSIEKRHPTHSIGADSDITDVWAWLVRQRERCTDLETQLQIKDANILAIEDLKRAKEQELEVLRCRTEKLVATIGEQTKDLTGFRETMAKQQLDNEERNLLLEERSRELQRFQEELSHTLKRDNEERSRLEEEISSAREQLGELRAQRDAGLDMIKETKDRLQQALYDLAEARDQVRNLEKNKDELVEKMMRKEEEASELTHKIRSLDKALAEHERHKTEREQLHQKLEAQLQDHLQRIEELQQQKAELLSEKTGLDARVASLEQDIDKAHENEAAVTKLHDEAQVQLSRTTTRNTELEAQTAELSREVERLKIDAQERQEVLRTTHAERVESGAMCNELQQKLGLAEVSLARVEAELAAAKQHSAALSGRLEQLSQEATQHTTEAADAKRDKAVAESAYESCKLTLDELKGLSKTLQHQLEEKERQLNEYLKQSRDGSAQSHAELARLQGKYEVASERIGTISQQLIESEDRRAALSAELAQLKETVQRKNRDSENNQVQDNAALQRLREDLASVTRERDGLTDQIGVNAQEVEKLQAELQRTQEELQLQAVDAEDGRRAIEREKTLMTRYQSGQLTEAETQLLAQAIASNAEQVTREISKRDNVIKGLEYEKRSFLDKLKKAQQEIESARKGSAQINAPRRSIALPASEPSSEADHQSTSSRVRFTGVEQVKTGQVQGGAGPSTTASIPSRSGAAKITRQYASRSQSLRPSASSGRRSVAGSALQALSQQPRDDDEVSNDADSMQNNEASSSTNPIGATSTENEQDSSTSVHTRRTVRRVRLS